MLKKLSQTNGEERYYSINSFNTINQNQFHINKNGYLSKLLKINVKCTILQYILKTI